MKQLKPISFGLLLLYTLSVAAGFFFWKEYTNPLKNIPHTPDYSAGYEGSFPKCSDAVLVVHHTATIPKDLLSLSKSQRERIGEGLKKMIINGEEHDNDVAYDFLIFTPEGTNEVKTLDLRAKDQHTNHFINVPTWHTGDFCKNQSYLGVAFVANFDERAPVQKEYDALNKLIKQFPSHKVTVHKDEKATACPGKYFDTSKVLRYQEHSQDALEANTEARKIDEDAELWKITGYYTPNINQEYFFRDPSGKWVGKYYPTTEQERLSAYRQDFKVNCKGDCLVTASGNKLHNGAADWVVACPPEFKFGTKFTWDGKERKCWDRGGAIKDKRLDVWLGEGDTGLKNLATGQRGEKMVTIKTN